MIFQGDCLEVMKDIDENSVDSIVTDPPYGLKFMGKDWDHGVPGMPFWEAALRVAKPGAHLLAFGGTRTFHRLAVAIEDAGWEIRNCVMWVYGSGFPKSHNVSKAIDKMDATEAAKQWNGWGTALKPAWEPVIMARKPFKGTVANNVLKHGTGAINIDRCRVEANGEKTGGNGYIGLQQEKGWNANNIPCKREQQQSTTQGRFPANFIHDGSDEVLDLFPTSKDGVAVNRNKKSDEHSGNKIYGKRNKVDYDAGYGQQGSAARFFYCAKANKKDKGEGNKHPTVKPTNLMQYLCRLVTPPEGVILDPFMGSGSTGKAAKLEGFNFIGIEIDEDYFNIAKERIKDE